MKEQERIPASEILEKNVKKIIERNKFSCGKTGNIRSLAQLAKEMDITAPSLTHALKGNPRLDTIQKMADALNVPIACLFYDMNKIEGYISINGEISHFQSSEEASAIINGIKRKDFSLL